MLKLGMKKGERVLVEFEGKSFWIIMGGYQQGSYRLLFDASKSINIVREKAIIKSKERLNENEQVRVREV